MTIPSINPNDLIVFHFVVSESSIKLAGEKLCLAQPTVSYHINTLEKSIGTKLFESKRGKIRLTQVGKDLAQYARQVYNDMAGVEQFIEFIRQPVLRAGIAFSFAVALRSVVPQFEQPNCKEVRLVMRTGASFDIVQDVLNSKLDVGIVVSMDYGNAELKSIPLSNRERMVIVASPFDPIFKKDKIELADLSGRKFIVPASTSASRQIFFKRLEAAGLKVQPSQFETVNNTEWSRYLVEIGEALDFLHIRNAEERLHKGQLAIVPVPTDFWIGAEAIVRKDTFITKAIDIFISTVRRTLKSQNQKLPHFASLSTSS
jgi:DNA-binding transcriptional LysR family regulator